VTRLPLLDGGSISDAGYERPPGVPDDAILRVLRVPPEAAGMRADVFVRTQLRNTSRTRARAIIERSAFTPLGKRVRPNDRVKAEERILLWRKPLEEDVPDFELGTLYEDEHLLALDKPPRVTVHPTARHYHHTVIKELQARRPGEFLTLIHRLDRETSGVLMVAKSPESDRAFKRMIEDRSLEIQAKSSGDMRRFRRPREAVEKTYLAITWGVPPEGLLDQPLEEDIGNSLRVKMRVAAPGRGLVAETGVELVEVKAGYALVRCALHTGRQHQIRVHLAHVGCPVVGDKLYGPDERMLARASDRELTERDQAMLELPRHALHAHRYAFTHPFTGEKLELVSPLARDLQEFWDGLS
jgi:23S rRNA pseudouridine1911/1915/1917 synthase